MANEIEFSFLEPSDLMKKTTYDPNTDNVVDVAKNIEGFDTATDDTFYGKVGGVTGFFSVPAGASSISDLTDVNTSGITSGQVLQYNGTSFVAATITGGGAESISDLTDVDTTGVATNNVLKYNGSGWVDGSVAYSEVTGTPTLSSVATSGLYTDLTGTPTLSSVATSGSYTDLSDQPTIPSSVNDLTDVDTSGITSGQVLQYNGTSFVAATVSSGATSIDDLTDVNLTGISTGQILNWDGSQFVPVNMPDGGGTTPTQLGELTNVDTTGQVTNDVLKFNGTSWVPDGISYTELADQPTLFSGSYNDLTDQPTIPSAVNDLTDVDTTGITSGQVLQYNGTNFVAATVSGGVESLGALTDVDTAGAATNNVLKYNGSTWVDGSVAYSEVTGTPTLSAVATSGNYTDLSNIPSIPSAINDLTDVDTTGITSGQVLQYNGTNFVAATITGSGGASSLDELSDVDTTTTAPTSGDALVYDGANFVPQAIAGGSGTFNFEWVELWYTSGSGGDLQAPDAIQNETANITTTIVNGPGGIVEFTFTGKSYPPLNIIQYAHVTSTNEYIITVPVTGTRKVSGGGATYDQTTLFSGTFQNKITLDCAMGNVGASAGFGQRARVYILFVFGE